MSKSKTGAVSVIGKLRLGICVGSKDGLYVVEGRYGDWSVYLEDLNEVGLFLSDIEGGFEDLVSVPSIKKIVSDTTEFSIYPINEETINRAKQDAIEINTKLQR